MCNIVSHNIMYFDCESVLVRKSNKFVLKIIVGVKPRQLVILLVGAHGNSISKCLSVFRMK